MYKEIEVFNQAELDAVPADFHGRILIKFGTRFNRAVLRRKFEKAFVEAMGNSSVVARGNSSVVAWGNSSVVALENSSVVARGNTQVVAASERAQVRVSGNARIVYNPKTPEEYAEHCGLECRDGVMILYKAVHKRDGSYYSDKDSEFEYKIGETVVPKYPMDTNPREDCGSGIHASHKAWCVDYGREWDDLAILEVEMPMASMVVPVNGSGKVRADRATVIREVPLEECGLLGKMLAKRRNGV